MGEVERRRGYGYNRVLIESGRILDPQFNDAVVFLSGAQIEMLRNVTQYLNRLGTYASEYNEGYYLVPTGEDFDDILEIVADMEETLMGNPNTIWGYNDRWSEAVSEEGIGAGDTMVETDPVPAGEVFKVEHWQATAVDVITHGVQMYAICGSNWHLLYIAPALPGDEWVNQVSNFTLKEGDYLRWRVINLAAGKFAYLRVMGYKMVVPE